MSVKHIEHFPRGTVTREVKVSPSLISIFKNCHVSFASSLSFSLDSKHLIVISWQRIWNLTSLGFKCFNVPRKVEKGDRWDVSAKRRAA